MSCCQHMKLESDCKILSCVLYQEYLPHWMYWSPIRYTDYVKTQLWQSLYRNSFKRAGDYVPPSITKVTALDGQWGTRKGMKRPLWSNTIHTTTTTIIKVVMIGMSKMRCLHRCHFLNHFLAGRSMSTLMWLVNMTDFAPKSWFFLLDSLSASKCCKYQDGTLRRPYEWTVHHFQSSSADC